MVASELSGSTDRIGSAQTELVTRRARRRDDASADEIFTAPYFSSYSSSIAAFSLISWESAFFDMGLIAPSSKISQDRTAGGKLEKIEGGGGYGLHARASFRVQARCMPLNAKTEGRGGYGLRKRASRRVRARRQTLLCADKIEGRFRPRPRLRAETDVTSTTSASSTSPPRGTLLEEAQTMTLYAGLRHPPDATSTASASSIFPPRGVLLRETGVTSTTSASSTPPPARGSAARQHGRLCCLLRWRGRCHER